MTAPKKPAAFRKRWVALSAFVTLLALAMVASRADVNQLRAAIQQISPLTFAAVGVLLFIGAALAVVRLWIIATDMGQRFTARDAILALSMGQIASALTVQFFGQIVARSALLAPKGVSAPANIVIAFYERLIAVFVSAGMAAIGSWFLFGRLTVDLEAGGYKLIRIAVGIVAATAVGAILGWGGLALHAMRPRLTRKALLSLARSAALTIAIQLITAAAYVVAAKGIAPEIPVPEVVAASVVIMFAASLPISFAGWGVRELSAVLALSAIGMTSSAALVVAVLIGVTALAVVILIAGIGFVLPVHSRAHAPGQDIQDQPNLSGLVKLALPISAATAVFFQVFIPLGAAPVNVNLADPVAILGAGVFLLYYRLWARTEWRLPHLELYIFAATAVIALAYLHGLSRFGWIDWAFTNKLIGWCMLLAYGATGALIARYAGDIGQSILFRTFAGAALGIVAFEFALLAVVRTDFHWPSSGFAVPLEGFSQNRNAFSFALLLSLCCVPFLSAKARPWAIGVLVAGLWYSGSRAALTTMIFLICFVSIIKFIKLRDMILGLLIAGGCIVFIAGIPLVITRSTTFTWIAVISPTADISNLERWNSIESALRLFMSHPVFGAGLGAYVAEQAASARVVIIHSTPLWIFAEMGLIGAAAFFVPAVLMLRREWRSPDLQGKMILAIIVTFGLMSSLHELLYQRGLWLLLGAALVAVPSHEIEGGPREPTR